MAEESSMYFPATNAFFSDLFGSEEPAKEEPTEEIAVEA